MLDYLVTKWAEEVSERISFLLTSLNTEKEKMLIDANWHTEKEITEKKSKAN